MIDGIIYKDTGYCNSMIGCETMDGCRFIASHTIHSPCVPISWGYRPIMIIKGMPIQINLSGHPFYYRCSFQCLTEVSLIKSFESFAVAGFVSCHFMDCVMDCVKVECFCSLCKVSLSCCCSIFSFDSHFKIFLC